MNVLSLMLNDNVAMPFDFYITDNDVTCPLGRLHVARRHAECHDPARAALGTMATPMAPRGLTAHGLMRTLIAPNIETNVDNDEGRVYIFC